MNPSRAIKAYLDAIVKIREAIGSLSSYGGVDFIVECNKNYHKGLFERFAPIKIGDRVIIAKALLITETHCPGWYGYKDKLKKGTKGIVRGIDFDGKLFMWDVEFDFNHNTFCMREGEIKKEVL